VTGGSRGIGLAIARRLARDDLAVCIVDINEKALARLAGGCRVRRFVLVSDDAAHVTGRLSSVSGGQWLPLAVRDSGIR
jgi:NAD(P)-dependent dehydrogenase (short-subunit alcohol dehydrogenase family)